MEGEKKLVSMGNAGVGSAETTKLADSWAVAAAAATAHLSDARWEFLALGGEPLLQLQLR